MLPSKNLECHHLPSLVMKVWLSGCGSSSLFRIGTSPCHNVLLFNFLGALGWYMGGLGGGAVDNNGSLLGMSL